MEGGALTALQDCPSTVTGVLLNNLLCRIQRFIGAVWKSDSMSCSMDAFSQAAGTIFYSTLKPSSKQFQSQYKVQLNVTVQDTIIVLIHTVTTCALQSAQLRSQHDCVTSCALQSSAQISSAHPIPSLCTFALPCMSNYSYTVIPLSFAFTLSACYSYMC
jgi:hypothetical protein